jgi:hypothetical protein
MADWTMQKTMPIQIQVLGSDEIERVMGYLTLLASSPGRGNAMNGKARWPAAAGRAPLHISDL